MEPTTNTANFPDVAVRIHSIQPEGSIRARCNLTLGGYFAVRNVKLMDGENGYWLAMPGYKSMDTYKDVCFPVNKEFRQTLLNAVVGEYEQAISQAGSHRQSAAQAHGVQEAPQQAAPFPEPEYAAPHQGGYEAGQQMAAM